MGVDEDTCNTVATKAIPLCMVQEDKAGKEACMQMTAKAIAKEEVGPVMKDCRCQAFNKIKDELLSAMELVCVERDAKQWTNWSPSERFIWLRYVQCHFSSFNCGWFTGNSHNFNRWGWGTGFNNNLANFLVVNSLLNRNNVD